MEDGCNSLNAHVHSITRAVARAGVLVHEWHDEPGLAEGRFELLVVLESRAGQQVGAVFNR